MIPLIPALVLAFLSFLCSAFVILRIIIPILPPHPLSRRVRPVRVLALRRLSYTDTAPSLNLVFLTSVLFPRQTRATYGSQHAMLSPSYSSHGKLWMSISAQKRITLSLRTLPLLSGFG